MDQTMFYNHNLKKPYPEPCQLALFSGTIVSICLYLGKPLQFLLYHTFVKMLSHLAGVITDARWIPTEQHLCQVCNNMQSTVIAVALILHSCKVNIKSARRCHLKAWKIKFVSVPLFIKLLGIFS